MKRIASNYDYHRLNWDLFKVLVGLNLTLLKLTFELWRISHLGH